MAAWDLVLPFIVSKVTFSIKPWVVLSCVNSLLAVAARTLVCLQAHPASAHAPKCVGWPLDVVWIVLCLCSHCRGFSDRPCSCGLDVGLQLLRQCTLTRGPSHHGVHCFSQPSWLAANSYCLNCKQLLPTILLEVDISQV